MGRPIKGIENGILSLEHFKDCTDVIADINREIQHLKWLRKEAIKKQERDAEHERLVRDAKFADVVRNALGVGNSMNADSFAKFIELVSKVPALMAQLNTADTTVANTAANDAVPQ